MDDNKYLPQTIDLGTNKITMDREPNYGFIFLKLETGDLPLKYQGFYTTLQAAHRAIDEYKEERKLIIEDIKEKKSAKATSHSNRE